MGGGGGGGPALLVPDLALASASWLCLGVDTLFPLARRRGIFRGGPMVLFRAAHHTNCADEHGRRDPGKYPVRKRAAVIPLGCSAAASALFQEALLNLHFPDGACTETNREDASDLGWRIECRG